MDIFWGILMSVGILIVVCGFWMFAYSACTESKAARKTRFDRLISKYRQIKESEIQKTALDTANELNFKIARGLIPISETEPSCTEIELMVGQVTNAIENGTDIVQAFGSAIENKVVDEICDTNLSEIVPKSIIEEDEVQITQSSDFFSWREDGDYLVLIANELIEQKLGSTLIRYKDIVLGGIEEAKIFNPNELVETIQVIREWNVVYEYPIIIGSECVLTDRYIISARHSSHAPFLVLRLSVNPMVIQAAKRRKEIEENERTIRIEQERREREEQERCEIEEQIREKHRRRQLYKKVEAEMIDRGEILKEAKRPSIPRDVQDAVYNRDGGKCVYCGSTDNLNFDHIIPFSKGGATNIENLQILCQKCNLEKSNHIG